ncbi:alpha-tocopherol transfer protein-like [Coccinella septempunctata]|uniref:alpha-tocopherol transfer protein-like n=1 Tax=Coccinella septempunctata TaxID=41139 RepID=UPI001D06ECF1|nr:alpha-tocopherol transfer protein-like [Coccinella septempunctata]
MFSIDKEYERDAKLRRQDVKSLMVWIDTQPHLPKISEHEAILFLKSCYYNNEFAKTTLDTYYSFRTLERDMFHARSDKVLIQTCKVGLNAPLSKLTPKGDSIFLMYLLDPNPEFFEPINLFKLADSVITLNLHLNGPHDGLQVISDMKNFTLGHLPKINLTIARKGLEYIQHALPVRLKGVHFININKTLMDMLMSLVRPFMNKELIDLIHIHSGISDLTKFIPLNCLPKDYGGQELSFEGLQEKMTRDMLENRQFFEYQDTQLVDEKKRPKNSKLSLDIFGVSGTFKKLELD